ncbi:MAG: MATE family efflux transporter [Treponema sp.]|nr:MATE family efflux transporter [Treponema sp.]
MNAENGRRIEEICTKRMLPLIIDMSVPAVCANIVTALYNFADRFFVGQFVGTDALGGIGITFPLNNITASLTVMISIGGSTMLSRLLGEKKYIKTNNTFSNIIIMSGCIGIVLSVLFFTFTPWLVHICGADNSSALFIPAVSYLHITSLGLVFLILNLALASSIRSEGNTRYALVVTLSGAVVNIILDPLTILVFHLGLEGAAVATVVSQVMSCLCSASYFIRGNSIIKWNRKFKPEIKIMLSVLALGSAPAVFQLLSFVNNTFINHMLMSYGNADMGQGGGDLAISAVSVISSVESFAIMFIMGMNNALSVIISYNYGCKSYARVKAATLTGQVISLFLFLLLWIIMMFIPRQLFLLFNSRDTRLAEYGVRAVRESRLFIFGLGFQTLASMYFSAIGNPRKATLISVSRNGLFLIPALLIIPRRFGLDGVLYSSSVSDCCSLVLVAIIYFSGIKKLERSTVNDTLHT